MDSKKILIVDDDQILLKMLERSLVWAGYAVSQATNGEEALSAAREWNPDLIILDIMMPQMDGGETAEFLQKDPLTKDIPIIFLTSLLTKQEENDGKALLGKKLLAKPYNPHKLLQEIEKHF